MDYELIASEVIRALRGKRSQPAFSRRLGYKSNVVYTWESGRGFPTAKVFLAAARRLGVSLPDAFAAFYRRPPQWLTRHEPATREGVSAFLNDLRGKTSFVQLARSTGESRFVIARWMKGASEPRLPDFLKMIEACSLRLLEFLEQFVDLKAVPSLRSTWETQEDARRLAYDAPWTHAVLRALELIDYQAKPREPGWIGSKIGIDAEVEAECLRLLEGSGQIEWRQGRWQPTRVFAVDTRKDPSAARRLKAWWGSVALERSARTGRGMAYNLFGISTLDLERLRTLQREYFAELRSIVASSEPVEHVCLAAMCMVDLTESAVSPSSAGGNTTRNGSTDPI